MVIGLSAEGLTGGAQMRSNDPALVSRPQVNIITKTNRDNILHYILHYILRR